MQIVETNVWEVMTEVAGKRSNRYGASASQGRVIVRIEDKDGNEGWGESVPLEYFTGETASVSADVLREAMRRLSGRSIDDPVTVIDELTDFSKQNAARTGLEVALLDLKGKVSGVPATHFLGGEKRMEISLYRGLGLLPPQEAVRRAQKYMDQGFSTFKIKVGVDLSADVERVLAIREAFQDKVNIRTDANGGYSPDEALRFCEKIQDVGIEHFEQPVRPDERSIVDIFRRIRSMGIPVAVDESLSSEENARQLIEEDAVDVGIIKIIKFGGPVSARKVCGLFEAAGKISVVSSPYESFIGQAAGLALALTLDNGGKAHEFSDPMGEAANWRHQHIGGRITRREGDGFGAWGLVERLEKPPSRLFEPRKPNFSQ